MRNFYQNQKQLIDNLITSAKQNAVRLYEVRPCERCKLVPAEEVWDNMEVCTACYNILDNHTEVQADWDIHDYQPETD